MIKDLRDPLSNHGGVEFSYDDSHHLLNCARLTLGYLKLSAAAVEIQKLMRNLSDAPLARARHKTRIVSLPSEDSVDVDFIGRAPELDKLSAWLSQPTNKRVLLAGDGGKGKSALAYRFASNVLCDDENGIDAVVWLRAKKTRFSSRCNRGHRQSELLRSCLRSQLVTRSIRADVRTRFSRAKNEASCSPT